jgi:hypothetical protein
LGSLTRLGASQLRFSPWMTVFGPQRTTKLDAAEASKTAEILLHSWTGNLMVAAYVLAAAAVTGGLCGELGMRFPVLGERPTKPSFPILPEPPILGIPAGLGLYASLDHGQALIVPPAWWLLATAAGTLLVVAGLTAIPARIGARRPVAEIL